MGALAGTLVAAACGAGPASLPDPPRVSALTVAEDGSFGSDLIAPRRVASSTKRRARKSAKARRRSRTRRRPAGPSSARHRTPQRSSRHLPRLSVGAGSKRSPADRAARRVAAARALIGNTSRRRPFLAEVFRRARQRVKLTRRPYDKALHKRLSARGKLIDRDDLRPGDVVFFKRTHDLNGNGRPDDGITWAALVDAVEDRRVVFIARRAGRVRRMAMSPVDPEQVRDGDLVLNTRLVQWPGSARPLTAGECFAAAARP